MHINIVTTPALAPLVSDLTDAATRVGLNAVAEQKEINVIGSMPWWMPTAIVLTFSREYFETIGGDASGEKSAAMKEALQRLFARVVGERREVRLYPPHPRAMPGQAMGPEHDALSAMVDLCTGQRAKLVIPCDLEQRDHATAINAMHELLVMHYKSCPVDPLSLEVRDLKSSSSKPVLLRFDVATGFWRAWTPGTAQYPM